MINVDIAEVQILIAKMGFGIVTIARKNGDFFENVRGHSYGQ